MNFELGPVYMRQDEVNLEWKLKLSTCLHETGTKITKFSIQYSPSVFPYSFSDQWLLFGMCCSCNVKVTAETGLKCIRVYIHPGLNSCRSEVSRFGPAGGMTWDPSELFSPRSHVNIYYIDNTMTETKWSRFDFVPVSCKREPKTIFKFMSKLTQFFLIKFQIYLIF
jgi:hypothetical protein